jgi:hypothetical protein
MGEQTSRHPLVLAGPGHGYAESSGLKAALYADEPLPVHCPFSILNSQFWILNSQF